MSGQNLRQARSAIHSDQIESFARGARDDFFRIGCWTKSFNPRSHAASAPSFRAYAAISRTHRANFCEASETRRAASRLPRAFGQAAQTRHGSNPARNLVRIESASKPYFRTCVRSTSARGMPKRSRRAGSLTMRLAAGASAVTAASCPRPNSRTATPPGAMRRGRSGRIAR